MLNLPLATNPRAKMAGVADGFVKLLTSPGSALGTISYMSPEQARAEARDLRKSIAGVQSAEFVASDGMYAGWNRTLSGLIQKVDEAIAMPMFSTSEMFDNLSGAASEMRNTVKDFRQDPRKYLRLKIF